MQEIIERISKVFSVENVVQQNNHQWFLTVPKKQALESVTYLRDREGFVHFVLLSCADWIESGKFQLTYLLNHPVKKVDIGIRVFIDREKAEMESAHYLWEQIATYQRELYEMFGITFPGSPRLTDPLLLEGWDNTPPMRRDFDTLKYVEETYFPTPGRKTNDPGTHMKEKLYPNE